MTPVTIIVPVFGQPNFVKRVLDSILNFGNLPTNKLIVINDAGPDSEQIRELVSAAMLVRPGIEYFENTKNLGFGATCNRAVFELDQTSNNILLLNSDAELTQGALEEMQLVLDASPRHACVGPRSNNGTIATIPAFSRVKHTREESHQLYFKHHEVLPPYSVVPVVSGYCMLIRRQVIQVHGLFDEIFSPGYEEENDFCLRVNSVGYSSVLANHAFVFHDGQASFGSRTTKLAERHARIMERRHPIYRSLIENYFRTRIDPVDKFLDFLEPVERPSVLIDCSMLTPRMDGTVRTILSFIDFLAQRPAGGLVDAQFTLLISREMAAYFGLEALGFDLWFLDEGVAKVFDVGFALSPLWSFDSLVRLSLQCSRIASLHLDIIGLRTWELNVGNLATEHSVYLSAELADLTLFISEAGRADLMHFRPRTRLRNGRVVPMGLVEDFALVSARSLASAPETVVFSSDKIRVLILGNGYKHKQVDPAIAAVENEGFEVIALSDKDSYGGNITRLRSGSLAGDHLQALFATADVVVYPSAYEGFGLPIAEARRAGKALVAFDTETTREVVGLLGVAQSTLLFSEFDRLPHVIREAVRIDVTESATKLRTSEDFNSEVLDAILGLAGQPVDPEFLRERAARLAHGGGNGFGALQLAQLNRRSVRLALRLADGVWGPIRRKLKRSQK